MFENHLIPSLMLSSIVLMTIVGLSPSTNIAIVGLFFGIYTIGYDLFLPIPSQIFKALYDQNWLSIPLAIFISSLFKNFIGIDEIILSWKKIRKKWRQLSAFILIIPINSVVTGLVGGTGYNHKLAFQSNLKKIYKKKPDSDLFLSVQLISVSVFPPSLLLLIFINSTGVDEISLFSTIIGPAFLYAIFCLLYLIIKINRENAYSMEFFANQKTKENSFFWKVVFLNIFFPTFVFGVVYRIVTIPEGLSIGIVLTTILIFFTKKDQYKAVLLSSFKQTAFLTSIIFFSFVCAQVFLKTFTSVGGDDFLISNILVISNDNKILLFLILVIIFILQFFFGWLEICFVFVPLLLPTISTLSIDITWFIIFVCFCIHNTSFLTPIGIKYFSRKYKFNTPRIQPNYIKRLPLFLIQSGVLISILTFHFL
ncbi:MAG: hypothetical protein CBD16_03950 [Betaproteobacteria bacterium TMED156]|nr:MAG: hypothetical protein CBD16_03950 [Betaproteobacteria bacterium TMED156]